MRQLVIILSVGMISVLNSCVVVENAVVMADGDIAVKQLRCEYRLDPLGIDVVNPRLSWILQSDQRCRMQSAYQILVAGSEEKLKQNKGNLWDSGKVKSDRSNQIVYKGKPLKSQTRCYWKVRVWDKDGRASAWSEQAMWTMGLLKASDWKAKWINTDINRIEVPHYSGLENSQWIWFPEGNPAKRAPIGKRYFRRTVMLPEGKKIKNACCVVAVDERFDMFINGQWAGQGSTYNRAANLDVTEYLQAGANVLAVAVTNEGKTENPAGLISSLRVEFAQGDILVVPTDRQWLVSRDWAANWESYGFDDSDWAAAKQLGKCGMKPWGKIASGKLILPSPCYMRKSFKLKKPVRRATVYASALGLYELHINGRRVGEDYFTPGWTDYNKRVYYNTYDVTDLLREGDNAIGSILADGWYTGYIGWSHKRNLYGQKNHFRAQLNVEYTDGTTEIIATGRSWKVTIGPLSEADFLMGETYDARKEMPGWDRPGFDNAGWQNVDVTSKIDAKVQAYPGVTVRKFAEFKPVKISEPGKGRYVFDMGQNFAGWVRLKLTGKAGDKIVLRFAERLNPDGTIYTVNLRGARATDTYICHGGGEEIWEPRFTFHGFQYVEVTGHPGRPWPETITGVAISSDTPVAGSFECSDKTANQLYSNICWTQRANFIDIPTDCPQRDERLGWTGDAQIYIRTATYNTDAAAFFTKWLVDLVDAQLPDGAFSDVAPRQEAMGGGTAAWADAGIICPWTIYQAYGDKRILKKHYKAMTRWIEYCKKNSKKLLRPATGYGDWLSIKADTPKNVLSTAYFAYSTKLMARIAEALGKKANAKKYNRLFEEIKKAFNKAYVADDGHIRGDTQTVYVLSLAFDLLPKDKRPLAIDHLVSNIEERDWHLSTGFVGTKNLMTTLTDIGRADVAYRLFHKDTFPSWGFSIRHGATSIWERWDGWTPEKGFQTPGMNSFAHYSFGAVGEWMFKTVAGIDTEGPGYKKIIIRPQPGGNLTWASASYKSIHGKIATHWKLEGDVLKLDVTIPVNTTATVYVPAKDASSVTEGGRAIGQTEGVRLLRVEGHAVVLAVDSGNYSFVSQTWKKGSAN